MIHLVAKTVSKNSKEIHLKAKANRRRNIGAADLHCKNRSIKVKKMLNKIRKARMQALK